MKNIINNQKLSLHIKLCFYVIIFTIISFQHTTTVDASTAISTINHNFNNDQNYDISLDWSNNNKILNITSQGKPAPDSLVSTGDTAKHYTITFQGPGYTSLTVDQISSMSASGFNYSSGMQVSRIQKDSNTQWRIWFSVKSSNVNSYVRSFNISGTPAPALSSTPVSGTISAMPSTVIIPQGQTGTTSIYWDVKSEAEVRDAVVGNVFHQFNNDIDQDISLNWNGSIANVISQGKPAPDSLVSTGDTAKHYEITFSSPVATIEVTSAYTASGFYDSGIYACKVEKNSNTKYKVWFCRSGGWNTYVRSFNITGTPAPETTAISTINHNFNNDTNQDISLNWSNNKILNITSQGKPAPDSLVSTGDTAKHYTITFQGPGYTSLTVDQISSMSASGFNYSSGMQVSRIQKDSNTQWRIWFSVKSSNVNSYVRSFNISGVAATTPVSGLDAQVYVSCNSDPEKLFAGAISGVQEAPWIGVDSNCLFNLYSGSNKDKFLSSVNVTGVLENNAPTATYTITSNIDYTTATSNWNYSDPDDHPQQDVEVKVYTGSDDSSGLVSTGTATGANVGNLNITGLDVGETYYPKVKVRDSKGAWSEWSNGPKFKTKDYPEPQVSFSLKSGTNTAQDEETLTVKTGDSVNANWSINNGTEIGLQSCALSTTGGNGVNLLSGTGFSGDVNAIGPENTRDLTYQVRLECTGKPAKLNRGFVQIINLEVQSYPVITSCNVDKNTVKSGQTNVNITAKVGNVSSYSFKIGRKAGDKQPLEGDASNPNLDLDKTLSYTGIEFGRYNPWVEVTSNGKTAIKQCPSVSNLGDSNIREVR